MLNQTFLNTSIKTDLNIPYLREQLTTLEVLAPLWPAIIFLGLLSNTTNILMFIKAGLKDSVTILLLSLSLSDACFLILITPTVSTIILFHFDPSWVWAVDPTIIHTLFYWPAFTFYDYSSYISVFLGVTRCSCVAMPLHFKSTFTKRRTVVGIVCLFCLAVLFHLPVLTIFSIGWRNDPVKNVSIPVLVVSGRQTMVKINDLVNRNTLPWISFITMISCVALLCFKLLQASKIRSLPASGDRAAAKTDHDNKLSPKDVHVVQSVVLVCSIFIIAQLPALLYSTVRVVNPDFDAEGRLDRLFGIFAYTSLTCSLLNATVNIFVYYNYNSKYRSVFRSFLNLS